jgi:hypothetical protein
MIKDAKRLVDRKQTIETLQEQNIKRIHPIRLAKRRVDRNPIFEHW